MADPSAAAPGGPPRQSPSGCLLIVLCIVSTALLIFGGCCIVLSSELSKTLEDWLTLGVPSLVIFGLGLFCARRAWRMHRRRKAARAGGPTQGG